MKFFLSLVKPTDTFKKTASGFTLVEMLVILFLLAAVITITISAINPKGQLMKARDDRRRSDLSQYRTGLEAYAVVNNGLYPLSSLSDIRADSIDGDDLCDYLGTAFLDSCPTDPLNEGLNIYQYRSNLDGSKAALWAPLESRSGYNWIVCTAGNSGEVINTTAVVTYCGL